MKIRNFIEDLVTQREKLHDHKLTGELHDFLINTLTTDLTDSIDKFINGSKEHGDDFLTAVHHIDELHKELIDARFYLAAIKYGTRRYDKRYNS